MKKEGKSTIIENMPLTWCESMEELIAKKRRRRGGALYKYPK